MSTYIEETTASSTSTRYRSVLEKTLQKIEVGVTPYLEIVDQRNAFIRIRSIEHPDEFVDVYKGTLTVLANALVETERDLSKHT
jgi:hypothetical protein